MERLDVHDSFGCPTFLNFGAQLRRRAGRASSTSIRTTVDSAYQAADQMVLARVPQGANHGTRRVRVLRRARRLGRPTWTAESTIAAPVFSHRGRCYRSSISYDAGIGRYLWCQIIPGEDTRSAGGFGTTTRRTVGALGDRLFHRSLGRWSRRDRRYSDQVDGRQRSDYLLGFFR